MRGICLCHELNEGDHLPKLASSVFGAHLADSIFVLDNGSEDSTLEVLERLTSEYPNRFVWETFPRGSTPNELEIRTETYHRAIHRFGYPDYFIFLDGDECLSFSLQRVHVSVVLGGRLREGT